jgi:hypothetical protein
MRTGHNRSLRFLIAALYVVAAAGATFLHAHIHHGTHPAHAPVAVHAAPDGHDFSAAGGPCPACFFHSSNLADNDSAAVSPAFIDACDPLVIASDPAHVSIASDPRHGRAPPSLPQFPC